jgi:hypothetical protein
MEIPKPKKGVGILALLGGSSADDDTLGSDDMAIKALYKAMVDKDESGFVEAFKAAVNECSESGGGECPECGKKMSECSC